MRKSALLLFISMVVTSASMPAFAQAKPAGSSDNKIVGGFKSVGKGIMWGPKKLWGGMKSVGKKMTGK